MAECPCGSSVDYNECCEPYIKGEKAPETAEKLLRSRYSAYTKGEIDYIAETIHPEQLQYHDHKATQKWSEESKWHGLEVLNIEKGQEGDEEGLVEFKAKYTQKIETHTHHEMAIFKKEEDKWFFYDGEPVAPEQFVREQPKVGRNEPCPCGSGKKFKKCCLK